MLCYTSTMTNVVVIAIDNLNVFHFTRKYKNFEQKYPENFMNSNAQ